MDLPRKSGDDIQTDGDPPWEHRAWELDKQGLGDMMGKQSGAISSLRAPGRHRGDMQEAEVPARKSDRTSRDFSDFDSLTSGRNKHRKSKMPLT